MKKFRVKIVAETFYDVVTEDEDEAIDIALGWFDDYMPEISVEEIVYGN